MDYLIKKGKHYSNWFTFPLFTFRKSIKFQFKIEKESHYELIGEDKWDWNKMFGLSNDWNHHTSSARICWRAVDENHYEVCLYCYDDGIRQISDPIKLQYGLTYGARIIISRNYFYLYFKDTFLTLARRKSSLFPMKLILKPFFGGNQTAPKDIKVSINVK